jgi:hypothetical protein
MLRYLVRSANGPRRTLLDWQQMLRQQQQQSSAPPVAAFSTTTSSSTSSRSIPTRHSLKGPPPMCIDPIELQEFTQQVLETPVGSLFCQNNRNRSSNQTTTTRATTTTTTSKLSSINQDRDDAYAVAQESTQLVEYLLRGYNHQLPGGLYASKTSNICSVDEASSALSNMIQLIERFEEEGVTYMKLRHELSNFQQVSSEATATTAALGVTASSLSSVGRSRGRDHDDNDDEEKLIIASSNSGSDDDDIDLKLDDFDEEIEIGNTTFGEMEDLYSSVIQHKHDHEHQLEEHSTMMANAAGTMKEQRQIESHLSDFALPGVTTVMYDTLLDALACSTELLLQPNNSQAKNQQTGILRQVDPADLYQIAQDALTAHELNNQGIISSKSQWFPYTVPTMVTYNATLRGIGNLCLAGTSQMDEESKQRLVDQGLACGFGMYNHLTNNKYALPKRNTASVIYLLKVIGGCLPPSRTRGNMTVTLWYQASREGLVTSELIAAIQELHLQSNGPEFDVFLKALEKCKSSSSSGNKAGSEKIVIVPQRFARFAKKYQHSKNY